ncbi:MAG: PQQ-binding-like beta-propeller repeat protein [Thermoplasmata archaeon]
MSSPRALRLAVFLILGAALLSAFASPLEAQRGSSWPMFRGDSEHRGFLDGRLSPRPALLYEVSTGGGLPTSPVSAGDRIYFGSSDGGIHCLHEANGTESWRFSMGDRVSSVPLLHGDQLFAISESGRLCAISASSGELRWELRLPHNGSFVGPLVASGERLIAVDDRGGVHCIGIENGGRLLWSSSVGGRVIGAPSIGGDMVYVPMETGSLTALYLANGTTIWTIDIAQGTIDAFTPAYRDGRLFIGTRGRTALCINSSSGAQIWSASVKAAVSTSAALDDTRVYFGIESGLVVALSQENGTELWSHEISGKISSSPVVMGEEVIVGSESGWLVGLEASTGMELWNYSLTSRLTASPALRCELLIVTTLDGKLLAFGPSGDIKPIARLEASTLRVSVDEPIRFSAINSSHPAGVPITDFSFDFGDGTSTGWISSASVEHLYRTKGNFNVELKVRAGDGSESAPAHLSVDVFNLRPSARLILPEKAVAGRAVAMVAEASDPDGVIALYEWDFEGDGRYDWMGTFLQEGFSHTYERNGTYAPTLRVTDDNGSSVVVSATLIVAAPSPSPAPSPLTQPAVIASISLSALALAGVALSATEFGKYRLLLFFIVPLYVRLKKDEVLDNYIRGKIHGYIIANPGDHYNSIRDALELSNGIVAHHLHTLEREGLIHSVRDGMYRRFFPANAKLPPEDEGHFNIQKRILAIIRNNPGISQKEIAQMAGVSSPTVNYHVSVLATARMIRVEKLGRRTRCFVIEREET